MTSDQKKPGKSKPSKSVARAWSSAAGSVLAQKADRDAKAALIVEGKPVALFDSIER